MIANRIRKLASKIAHSPGHAGVRFDVTNDQFKINPDGTERVFQDLFSETFLLVAGSVDTHCFIADRAYKVASVKHIVSVGASGATLDVKKCTGTQAPAAGTTTLNATLDLNATANTTTTAVLSATPANLLLAAGDRLALDFSGTLTGLVGAVTIYLRRQ